MKDTSNYKVSTEKMSNLEPEDKNMTKDLFCYISLALTPIILFSYRFLPKVETIEILGLTLGFNGFKNSYSYLFAFLSKAVPLLLILVFYLNPKPLKISGKEIGLKHFLFPISVLFFYQLVFIVFTLDKIDEGFYTELTGWSIAVIMSLTIVFSNSFFRVLNKFLTSIFLSIVLLFNSQKRVIKNMVRLILKIKEEHYPKMLARAMYLERKDNSFPSNETSENLADEFDKDLLKTFDLVEGKS